MTVTLAQAFPVLPGNLVLFQAAAVVPLTASYGVPAAEALAFSVVLQATEAVVGVAVGFLFLIAEGVGFGTLRRQAEEEERRAGSGSRPPRPTRSPGREHGRRGLVGREHVLVPGRRVDGMPHRAEGDGVLDEVVPGGALRILDLGAATAGCPRCCASGGRTRT